MRRFVASFFFGLRNMFFIFLPSACRYYPSCSEYMKQSIENRGVFLGSLRGLWRVCRCNPLSKGGFDPAS